MTLETSSRLQKAVYWEASGVDNHGCPKLKAPIEVDVRWEQVARTVLHDDSFNLSNPGKMVAIVAEVIVDRKMPQGSVLWLGELADLVGTGSSIQDLCEVCFYEEVPDLKGRNIRRSVTLMRSRDVLYDLVS